MYHDIIVDIFCQKWILTRYSQVCCKTYPYFAKKYTFFNGLY